VFDGSRQGGIPAARDKVHGMGATKRSHSPEASGLSEAEDAEEAGAIIMRETAAAWAACTWLTPVHLWLCSRALSPRP